MDKIKFRAWCPKTRKMYSVLSWKFDGRRTMTLQYKPIIRELEDNLIVLQYIGTDDQKGVSIHKGDVVKFEHYEEMDWTTDEDCGAFSDQAQISLVRDNHGEITGNFDYCSATLIRYAMQYDYVFEVIGNIYENPELLEGQNDK